MSKEIMVNAADVERSCLEVALQACRDNSHVRRPDGRKSPMLLCGEEALRLRENNARLNKHISDFRDGYKVLFRSYAEATKRNIERNASRWFRLGQRLGFYE